MKGQIATGYLVGDGAAQNVELGWYPDLVILTNLTDGDLITIGHLKSYSIPFSGGGTTEVEVGDTIKGATSAATAVVQQVLLSSGTWAGGDAAGFFIVNSVTGTFQSENVYVDSDSTSGSDDATVTANVQINVAIAAAAAAATGTSAISRYAGVAGSASIGFTIGSVLSEEAKLLYWIAIRGDQ